MKIYRRIINKKNLNDDCIYELAATQSGYVWNYLNHSRYCNIDAPILYKQRDGKYTLSGSLSFSPEDLEPSDGNTAASSE